jgi:protein transport protein SEC24
MGLAPRGGAMPAPVSAPAPAPAPAPATSLPPAVSAVGGVRPPLIAFGARPALAAAPASSAAPLVASAPRPFGVGAGPAVAAAAAAATAAPAALAPPSSAGLAARGPPAFAAPGSFGAPRPGMAAGAPPAQFAAAAPPPVGFGAPLQAQGAAAAAAGPAAAAAAGGPPQFAGGAAPPPQSFAGSQSSSSAFPPRAMAPGAGGPPPVSMPRGPPVYGQQQQQQQPPTMYGAPPGGPPQQQQQQQQPPQQQYAQQPPQQQQQYAQQPPQQQYAPRPAAPPPAPAAAPAPAAPRIDPNQIPRPRYTSPAHPVRYNTTDSSANTPPAAWADFIADDTGNANPRFLRSTLGHVPTTKDILKDSRLALALVVSPLATPRTSQGERPVLAVDFGDEGPIRCTRCRGYINPWVRWSGVDGGRSWTCTLCGMVNETPGWYMSPAGIDHNGYRRDRADRPELSFGTVEFCAPKSYLIRNPSPLVVAFVVDVSLPAITSGLLSTVLTAIGASLDAILASSNGGARVGIITYDTAIHFYDVRPGRKDILQAVAGDADDSFCPLPLDQWAPPLAAARGQIEALLARIPALFPPTTARSTQSCGGAAIKSAVDGLGETGGRVVSYILQPPTVGEGKLGNREAAKNYGVDKEKELYTPAAGPAGAWYIDLARHAASRGVCVDLAACAAGPFLDLPTQAVLTTTTGGDITLYPFFAAPNVAPTSHSMAPVQPVPEDVQEKVTQELIARFSREMGGEAVLKLRTSPGVRVDKYMGNFSERTESEADLAGVDSEKAVLVMLVRVPFSGGEGEGGSCRPRPPLLALYPRLLAYLSSPRPDPPLPSLAATRRPHAQGGRGHLRAGRAPLHDCGGRAARPRAQPAPRGHRVRPGRLPPRGRRRHPLCSRAQG